MSILGLWISGERPSSKKEVKSAITEAFAMGREQEVVLEETSLFSRTGNRTLDEMAVGETITFVGPDPQRNRKFYGNITRTAQGYTVK